MRSVSLIETDRADRSPLEPVRAAIEAHPGLELQRGNTADPLPADVWIVLGDRLDALDAAIGAARAGAVLVHLHGGEITTGSQDNRWRFALSAIADVHCVATRRSAVRLMEHGEEPDRIHVVGAPGLDRLRDFVPYERGTHADEGGHINIVRPSIPEEPFVLCTVHPEVTAEETFHTTTEVYHGLQFSGKRVVWTAPNGDVGRHVVDDCAKVACLDHHAADGWTYIKDAGTALYLSLMHHAAVMVGNSSSGIIEAPEFGLPVVNVGRRQDGRERAGNVWDVPADAGQIASLIESLTTMGRVRKPMKSPYNPHGDYNASGRIADIIAEIDLDEFREKTFAT